MTRKRYLTKLDIRRQPVRIRKTLIPDDLVFQRIIKDLYVKIIQAVQLHDQLALPAVTQKIAGDRDIRLLVNRHHIKIKYGILTFHSSCKNGNYYGYIN